VLLLLIAGRILIGDPVPPITLSALDGSQAALPGEDGQVTVIDFFATWCGPCRDSLPAMARLRKKFAERGVSFVSVSVDDAKAKAGVARYARAMKLEPPILLDPKRRAFDRLGIQVLPTIVIVDAAGALQTLHEGFGAGFESALGKAIDRALRGERAGPFAPRPAARRRPAAAESP
jgi:thiol-disulfide isomerase/thioredoxin